MTDTSTPESSVSASSEAEASSATAEETKTSETVASDGDLFRQSEIAADYVEGLLDILDSDGDIDLVYKRSTDGGVTWSALRRVVGAGRGTWGNPTAVVDRRNGKTVSVTGSGDGGFTRKTRAMASSVYASPAAGPSLSCPRGAVPAPAPGRLRGRCCRSAPA